MQPRIVATDQNSRNTNTVEAVSILHLSRKAAEVANTKVASRKLNKALFATTTLSSQPSHTDASTFICWLTNRKEEEKPN